MVESAWGAVPELLLVRFPSPTQPRQRLKNIRSGEVLKRMAVVRLLAAQPTGNPPGCLAEDRHGLTRTAWVCDGPCLS